MPRRGYESYPQTADRAVFPLHFLICISLVRFPLETVVA